MALLHRLDGHEMLHLADHPADAVVVRMHLPAVELVQAQHLHGALLRVRPIDRAAHERDLELECHGDYIPSASCSTVMPRLNATCSRERSCLSATIVAWMTLSGLLVPMHFDKTSWMPAHSTTARTGPPAI